MKYFRKSFEEDEDGFTLLNGVITAALIVSLASTGLMLTDTESIKDNIVKSRVDTMARSGYDAGRATLLKDFEASLDEALQISGDQDIELTYEKSETEGLCVKATYIGERNLEHSRTVGYCDDIAVNPETDLDEEIIEEPEINRVMKSQWDISAANHCRNLTLPISGDVDVEVDWGDGVIETITRDEPSHRYSRETKSTSISIKGVFDNWGTLETAGEESIGWEDSKCLVSVDEWENTGTTSLKFAFIDADNLKHVEEIPRTTTSLYGAFYRVDSAFTLGDIYTGNVTDMEAMFHEATLFNQPISLDTSKVTNMQHMFCWAHSFNQPLNFDTSNVVNMRAMFENTRSFNQPLNFDTSKVKDMSRMFYDSWKFNQSLSRWNVSNVKSHYDFKSLARYNFREPKWS